MQLITEKAPEPPRERPPASQFRQLSRNAFGVEETCRYYGVCLEVDRFVSSPLLRTLRPL